MSVRYRPSTRNTKKEANAATECVVVMVELNRESSRTLAVGYANQYLKLNSKVSLHTSL